jgi:osmotically-inducible protein OsmY
MKPDRQLQQDVVDELRWEPSLDEKEVGVNVTGGLVTLTGRGEDLCREAGRSACGGARGWSSSDCQ